MPANPFAVMLSAIWLVVAVALLIGGFGFEKLEAVKVGLVLLVVGLVNLSVEPYVGMPEYWWVFGVLVVGSIGAIAAIHRDQRVHHR